MLFWLEARQKKQWLLEHQKLVFGYILCYVILLYALFTILGEIQTHTPILKYTALKTVAGSKTKLMQKNRRDEQGSSANMRFRYIFSMHYCIV